MQHGALSINVITVENYLMVDNYWKSCVNDGASIAPKGSAKASLLLVMGAFLNIYVKQNSVGLALFVDEFPV